MSEAYLIEATDPYRRQIDAGLVLRERGGFRFFAAHTLFAAIENQLFRRPAEAERAAAALLARAGDTGPQDSTARDAAPLADPLALPPDWQGAPGLLALSLLPFDR